MNTKKSYAITSNDIDEFENNGFILLKDVFKEKVAEDAAKWLHLQDLESLAKTWTDKEPLVPLAVYQNIHQGVSPISRLASSSEMLEIASLLIGDKVYIWSSKVNLKAAWCGTVEYPHQDYCYWFERGYKKMDMLSCMIFLEPHGIKNGGLCVFPGSHNEGFIEHTEFININGLSKYTILPEKLNEIEKKCGFKSIEGNPGDVLFFHTALVHGSSHNLSSQSRMVILSQLNSVGNKPVSVKSNTISFNLKRSEMELKEAERRLTWFKQKYESQSNSQDIEFNSPIPAEEI